MKYINTLNIQSLLLFILKLFFKDLYFYLYYCLVYICLCITRLSCPEENVVPETDLTDSCELLVVGVGNGTRVLLTAELCLLPQNKLS